MANNDEKNKMSVNLLGLTGSGKSSALNVILERAGSQYSVNGSAHEPAPPTVSCKRKEVFAAGRRLILVDTPELWDEDGVENVELVKDCLALAEPGPHVFLLVLRVGRFTQGECKMLGQPQKINNYVAGAHSALRDLVRKCGSRYYELDIIKSQNALSYPQVKDLLSGINKLVASHGGHPHPVKRFSLQELQERNKVIEERKEGALEVNYLLRENSFLFCNKKGNPAYGKPV